MKIASLDNLLFFLLIAAAALFQLLSKAVTKAGKGQSDKTSTPPTPPRPPQVRRAPAESDADRIRKFLEALGQPPTSTPPAPVAHRTDIPPRPVAPVQPPAVIPRAWRLPRQQQTKRDISQREIPPPEQPRHVEFVRPTVPASVAPAFEVHEGALAVELEQPTIAKTVRRSWLSRRSANRQRARFQNRHCRLARIEIWPARSNHPPRNFRSASRCASVRSAVAFAAPPETAFTMRLAT